MSAPRDLWLLAAAGVAAAAPLLLFAARAYQGEPVDSATRINCSEEWDARREIVPHVDCRTVLTGPEFFQTRKTPRRPPP